MATDTEESKGLGTSIVTALLQYLTSTLSALKRAECEILPHGIGFVSASFSLRSLNIYIKKNLKRKY